MDTFGVGSTSLAAQEAVLSCSSPSAHPVLGLLLDPPLLAAQLVLGLLLVILLLVLHAPVLSLRKLVSIAPVPVPIQ